MIIIILIFFVILSIIFSIYPLYKNGDTLELIVVFVILTLSCIYGTQFYLDTYILPNPNILIDKLEFLAKAMESYFEI
ncbi:MAG: hypothetical protein GX333_02250 [Syntrophomonadaceae bacterium]|nr:hypothetical protein [Syntrophomonadaceae bacterium]